MRELKFRQAIFLKGKFHHWHYWGFVGHRNEFIGPITISGVRSEYQIRESQTFTGLLDKNAQEIYEGDIINIRVNHNSAGYMGRNPKYFAYTTEMVAFYRGHFISYNPQNNLNQPIENHSPQSLRDFMSYCYESEVIGNIYENPELLKEV